MPAWEFRLAEEDLWAVVAFLERLPDLTPQQYAEATQASVTVTSGPAVQGACGPRVATNADAQGDVRRGAKAIHQYACGTCHTIPGVTGSQPNVGPPLAGVARRAMIGGKLANTPDNMVRWLRHTREVDPQTAMPQMGVTQQDARDIAAYLGTLD
jgi:cytochrome c2